LDAGGAIEETTTTTRCSQKEIIGKERQKDLWNLIEKE
jgi:hypothetical protein